MKGYGKILTALFLFYIVGPFAFAVLGPVIVLAALVPLVLFIWGSIQLGGGVLKCISQITAVTLNGKER